MSSLVQEYTSQGCGEGYTRVQSDDPTGQLALRKSPEGFALFHQKSCLVQES